MAGAVCVVIAVGALLASSPSAPQASRRPRAGSGLARVAVATLLAALQFSPLPCASGDSSLARDCGTHHPTPGAREEVKQAQDVLRSRQDYAALIKFDPNGVWARRRRGWFGPSDDELSGVLQVPVKFVIITDGSMGKVTAAQMQAQVRVLNAGFSGRDATAYTGTDTKIRYALSTYTYVDNRAWFKSCRSREMEYKRKHVVEPSR